ncbi:MULTISPECIES: alpha/beta hydrolase [Variovorax]|uniref:alpha/beta hydrolase n=1 Tax=Variovorax TaxID=34072 RepID=UPI00086E93CB|nr:MULTISPECIES: alpha/beta fold hydrolase [Variovorax]MBN8753782.1 alpha/beta fold hydrolase [Variovorax sp.]ODU17349.1 MAG: alpha/beta hydrolase [Variovorax sp. SCN 67-85]OJZ02727.1 MAG: alpha/beta hydrolase [Variovorax sp. 67-131]UKI11844.1 lysophospholipase [Variovorax paradoxus]
MKRWTLLASVFSLCALLAAGCSTLDEQQRQWIFQPSDRSWGNTASMAQGMEDVWIDFQSSLTGEPARLHGLWLGGKPETTDTPVLLYLHGARYNVAGSAPRIQRMHELGFSVLAIDYRGFGKSSKGLPSEESAREDARAAWTWLAARHPKQHRYIFGHSLGGAIGIDLAAHVNDESGVIVESTFTSIADVVSGFKWGWLPFGPFITQRFEAINTVKNITAPLLVVHGTADSLINPTLGRKLYDAATVPKLFVLVEGGSHHDTNSVGEAQYRAALAQLFRMKPEATLASNGGPARPTPRLAPPANAPAAQDVRGAAPSQVPAAI